jgi:hypothetical protein
MEKLNLVMNKRRLIAFLGIAVGVTAIAGSASASIQPEFATYGSSSSPLPLGSTESLSLPQFNPSLGTLTGVTVELCSRDTISSVVFNFTGQSAAYSAATATVPVTVKAALDDYVLTTSAQGTAGPFAGLLSAASVPRVAGSVNVAAQSAVINPGDLGFYQGKGDLPITLTVPNSVGSYSGNGGSSLFFGGNGYSYGTVEVDYSYISSMDDPGGDPPGDPPGDPIPEPGTLCAGLAVISICGIEFARRFRRTSSRA